MFNFELRGIIDCWVRVLSPPTWHPSIRASDGWGLKRPIAGEATFHGYRNDKAILTDFSLIFPKPSLKPSLHFVIFPRYCSIFWAKVDCLLVHWPSWWWDCAKADDVPVARPPIGPICQLFVTLFARQLPEIKTLFKWPNDRSVSRGKSKSGEIFTFTSSRSPREKASAMATSTSPSPQTQTQPQLPKWKPLSYFRMAAVASAAAAASIADCITPARHRRPLRPTYYLIPDKTRASWSYREPQLESEPYGAYWAGGGRLSVSSDTLLAGHREKNWIANELWDYRLVF